MIEISPVAQNALAWITGILNRHNVPFQITGGFAAKIYGSPRPLNDIDIDIPRNCFERILPEVEKYIIFGPEDYKSEKWDLYIMTINYNGQEMDIGSADVKIYDSDGKKWIQFDSDFSKVVWKEVNGLKVPVMPKDELAGYKKYLDGDHQLVDIEAIKANEH